MEGTHLTRRPTSRETLGGGSSSRLRFDHEHEEDLFKATPAMNCENRVPAPLPSALSSMLRNTTETGDIGQFSIKPYCLPERLCSPGKVGGSYNGHAPARPQHELRLLNVPPTTDDRKCLPSYTRDVTSEVVSMYETASQKASGDVRVFEDNDYRSYSMTQTSYMYTLSNHRSYASLRSQPESSLVQRPRSPFPYPARLKRPGFRPSSPVLGDGGRVDYSRRAEIERTPNEIMFNKSSPTSLRTQRKGSQPSALRSEGSKSTASQLELSPSPQMAGSEIIGILDNFRDWKNRPEPLLGNSSPAQSTLSLDSAVNLYQSGPAAPSALASRNLHPPVPLYYDYTEEFDIEEGYYSYNRDNLHLPPSLIDSTIREDRKFRPDCSLLDSLIARPPEISIDSRSQDSQSSRDMIRRESAATSGPTIPSINPASEAEDALNIPPHREARSSLLSGSEAAVEAFNQGIDSLTLPIKNKLMHEPPTKSSDLDIKPHSLLIQIPKSSGSQENYGQEDTVEIDRASNRNSSYGLLAYIPAFPNPPDRLVSVRTDTVPAACSHRGFTIDSNLTKFDLENPVEDIRDDRKPLVQLSRSHSLVAPPNSERNIRRRGPQRSASAKDERTRSSRVYSVDCSSVDLAQLITRFEKVNESLVPEDLPSLTTGVLVQPLLALPRHGILRDSLTLHSGQVLPRTSSLKSRISLNKFRSEGDLRGATRCQYPILAEGPPFSCNDVRLKRYEAPSFSHRILRKSLSRSTSPILAPEPISPVRMLKLKNSIPHLMKALPPIPLDSMGEAHQESKSEPRPNTESIPTSVEPNCIDSVETVPLADDASSVSPKPPKLKLKSKPSLSQRARSLSNTRQCSPDESHLWIDQYSNAQLPATRSEKHVGRTTGRVKLRATKASRSTEGTVRINKDASHKVVNNLEFRHPKDLFTPPGIGEIFRQVGRHLTSRKTSHPDKLPIPLENSNTLDPAMIECQQGSDLDSLLDLGLPQRLAATACPISPTEVQSFFSDDSSQVRGHNSLRQRISNFRARIPVPYTSRPVAQSYDDVAWRERSSGTTPVVKWSTSHLDANGDQSIIPETAMRPHGLRLRFSDWFKGARSAVAGCVRQRDSDELK